MGLMDKIWDEVFAGPQPGTQHPTAPQHPRPQLNLKLDIPMEDALGSPRGLERSESTSSPAPSPGAPYSEGLGGRQSSEFGDVRKLRPSASEKITVRSGAPRRSSLDSARSLPNGYGRFMPEILSPGSRKDENVWRSVFNPGASNRAMDSLGASKFDKASPKGPSVYDWFYRPECRSQYR